jgi:flagellar hook-associated protein 3 FlgL
MRVTFNSLNDGVAALNVAAAALDRAQDQLATGKRLRAASDDPLAAQRALDSRADISTLDAYTRTTDSAEARISSIDTILTDVIERITEAKVTAAGARSTTATPESREAAALHLEGLRDAILGDINTSLSGTHLFSGGEAFAVPYALVAGVWTYQGNNAAVTVSAGSGQPFDIALDGQAIMQGTDATNVLTELDTLAAAIRAGDDAGIAAGMAALDRAFDRTTLAQSRVGVDLNGLEENQRQIDGLRLASRKRLSRDEDADLAQAASDLARADTAYRAALSAISTAGRVSLMDFLR